MAKGGRPGSSASDTGPIVQRFLPSLEGTEKQVNWAENIRTEYMRQYNAYQYALNQVQKGNENGRASSEETYGAKYGTTYRGIMQTTGRSIASLVKDRNGIKTSADILKRVKKTITTEKSAKFWIDNR